MTMISDLEPFDQLLSFLWDESDEEGFATLRAAIGWGATPVAGSGAEAQRATWERLKEAVAARSLKTGEPLKLVLYGANRSPRKDTDEEAYRWLELLIRNVERTDGKIDPY